jgi:hypothetical protein
MNAIDQAIEGASTAALTHRQKGIVCAAARSAWERAGRPFFEPQAAAEGCPLALTETEALALWRQEQQQEACGRRHLTAATQADYPLLRAHFDRLNGRVERAEGWAGRAALDPVRQARAKLERTLEEVAPTIDRPRDYALAIAARQYRAADLESLTAKQLWSLVYTLRNRAAARRNKP